MEETPFATAQKQFRKYAEPATQTPQLIVDHLGRLADFQLKAARSYGEIALQNLSDMTNVNNLDSLKAYTSSQSDRMIQVSNQLIEDFRTLGALGADLRNDLQALYRDEDPHAPAAAEPSTEASAS